MNNIKISFCIPCYNVEKYINACLNSIEAQELNKNEYEIICIDDCSTDSTFQILKNRAHKNLNIKVLQNKSNNGVSYTRNKLIEKANGEFLWFIDADDMIVLNSAKFLLNIAENNNLDVITGYDIAIQNDFSNYNKYYIDTNNLDEIKIVSNSDNVFVADGVYYGLIRTEKVKNKIFFDEKLFLYEDFHFLFELSLMTLRCFYTDLLVVLHRLSENSITRGGTSSLKLYNSNKRSYFIYKNYLKISNLPENKRNEIFNRLTKINNRLLLLLLKNKDYNFVKNELIQLESEGLYFIQKNISKKNIFNNYKEIFYNFLKFKPFFILLYFINNRCVKIIK